MNYLVTTPVLLDDNALVGLLGSVRRTGYAEGLRLTLAVSQRGREVIRVFPKARKGLGLDGLLQAMSNLSPECRGLQNLLMLFSSLFLSWGIFFEDCD